MKRVLEREKKRLDNIYLSKKAYHGVETEVVSEGVYFPRLGDKDWSKLRIFDLEEELHGREWELVLGEGTPLVSGILSKEEKRVFTLRGASLDTMLDLLRQDWVKLIDKGVRMVPFGTGVGDFSGEVKKKLVGGNEDEKFLKVLDQQLGTEAPEKLPTFFVRTIEDSVVDLDRVTPLTIVALLGADWTESFETSDIEYTSREKLRIRESE